MPPVDEGDVIDESRLRDLEQDPAVKNVDYFSAGDGRVRIEQVERQDPDQGRDRGGTTASSSSSTSSSADNGGDGLTVEEAITQTDQQIEKFEDADPSDRAQIGDVETNVQTAKSSLEQRRSELEKIRDAADDENVEVEVSDAPDTKGGIDVTEIAVMEAETDPLKDERVEPVDDVVVYGPGSGPEPRDRPSDSGGDTRQDQGPSVEELEDTIQDTPREEQPEVVDPVDDSGKTRQDQGPTVRELENTIYENDESLERPEDKSEEQRIREQVNQQSNLDDLAADSGVLDQAVQIFQDEDRGTDSVREAVQDTGEEVAELGTEIMLTGQDIGRDVEETVREESRADGVGEDIGAGLISGAATLGTQAPGYFIAGAGSALYLGAEAAQGGDEAQETGEGFVEGAQDFGGLITRQLSENTASFVSEEVGEELSEFAIFTAATGGAGAVLSAVPTFEPTVEAEPEPSPDGETGGDIDVQVNQGARLPRSDALRTEVDEEGTVVDTDKIDRRGEVTGVQGDDEAVFESVEPFITAVVEQDGDTQVFAGRVESTGRTTDDGVEGVAEAEAVQIDEGGEVGDLGESERRIFDFEAESEQREQRQELRLADPSQEIVVERSVEDVEGRSGESEFIGRGQEERVRTEDFDQFVRRDVLIDEDQDGFIDATLGQAGRTSEFESRGVIFDESFVDDPAPLDRREVDISDAQGEPDIDEAQARELAMLGDELFTDPADPEPEAEPDSVDTDQGAGQAVEEEPVTSDFDELGGLAEAEAAVFEETVRQAAEPEPEVEPAPGLGGPELFVGPDPQQGLDDELGQGRRSVEQGRERSGQRFGVDSVAVFDLSFEAEQVAEPQQSLEVEPSTLLAGPEPLVEPEPEPSPSPQRTPTPLLDDEGGQEQAQDLALVGDDDEDAPDEVVRPSLEAVLLDIEGEQPEDDEITGFEIRPLPEEGFIDE